MLIYKPVTDFGFGLKREPIRLVGGVSVEIGLGYAVFVIFNIDCYI